MNKSRKSKKAFIVAAIALMAALVVGMGAMTYSKYITTSSKETTATAAKWGFVITANADDLFGTDYTKDGDYATKVEEDGVAVKAAELTLAPGTSGSMELSVNGTAEVRAQVKYQITDIQEIRVNEDYPVKWTLKQGANVVDGCNGVQLSVIAAKLGSLSSTIEAGEQLSNAYTLSWVWAFEGNNANDTLIGMQAHYESLEGDEKTAYFESTLRDVKGAKDVVCSLSFILSITVEQAQ